MKIYSKKIPSSLGFSFYLGEFLVIATHTLKKSQPKINSDMSISFSGFPTLLLSQWVHLRARGLLYNMWKLAACASLCFPVSCPPVFFKSFPVTIKLWDKFFICKNIYSACIKKQKSSNMKSKDRKKYNLCHVV